MKDKEKVNIRVRVWTKYECKKIYLKIGKFYEIQVSKLVNMTLHSRDG